MIRLANYATFISMITKYIRNFISYEMQVKLKLLVI